MAPTRSITGLGLALALWGLQAIACESSTAASPEACDSVLVYGAQGVDRNVLQMPGAILTANLHREPTYLGAVSYKRVEGRLDERIYALRGTLLGPVRHGLELFVAKHHGLQSVTELGAAWFVRSPDLGLYALAFNLAGSLGLSHTLGTPTYEDGPRDNPSARYRTQIFMALDIEARHSAWKDLSLVARLHHRSGGGGLVAPRNVGSNFVALGVRYSFDGL